MNLRMIEYEFRLTTPIYRTLVSCLIEYTEIPEDKRPPLLRALFYHSMKFTVGALQENYIILTDEYHYGNRLTSHQTERVFRFNLSGTGAEIVQWWMELGFDAKSIKRNNYPPIAWDLSWNEDDYMQPSYGNKIKARVSKRGQHFRKRKKLE